MSVAITLRNLTLGYDQTPSVQSLEMDITEGSLTAIVGPNGAGKSTLLKGVTGNLKPLDGHIEFGSLAASDIAYLPQQSDIDRSFPLSVIDIVSMGLWKEIGPFGTINRAQRHRVHRAISAVGLDGLQNRLIGSLSGGQFQRALFARLLLQDAKMVLLDEPFSAVDSRTVTDLLEIIQRWHSEGRTVLVVLHDHDTVKEYFPQTLLIARELVAHGPTENVLTAENQFKARQMCEACDGPPHKCRKKVA